MRSVLLQLTLALLITRSTLYLWMGTAADYSVTQYGLHHGLREANPVMPTNPATMALWMGGLTAVQTKWLPPKWKAVLGTVHFSLAGYGVYLLNKEHRDK